MPLACTAVASAAVGAVVVRQGGLVALATAAGLTVVALLTFRQRLELAVLGIVILLPLGSSAGTQTLAIISPAKILAVLSLVYLLAKRQVVGVHRPAGPLGKVLLLGAACTALAWVPYLPYMFGHLILAQTTISQFLLVVTMASVWAYPATRSRFGAVLLSGAVTIASVVLTRGAGPTEGYAYGGVSRSAGYLHNPNLLGSVGLMLIGIIEVERLQTDDRVYKSLARLVQAGLVAVIIVSLSRGAVLGLVVFVSAIIGLRTKSRISRLACAVGIPVLLYFSLSFLIPKIPPSPFVNTWRDRVLSVVKPSQLATVDNSVATRSHLLHQSVASFARSPFIGHGPDSYQTALGEPTAAHNLYAGLAVEYGAVGLAGAGLLTFAAVLFFLRSRERSPVGVAAALLCAYLAFGLTADAAQDQAFWISCGVLVGLGAVDFWLTREAQS